MAEQRRLSQAARQLGAALITSLRTLLPVAAAFLLWQGEARATHAMGGELTYECVGANLYRVQLNFYRDCNGVAAPTNCSNGRQFRLRSTQCGATVNACFGLDGVETVTPICLTATDRCTDSNGDYGIQRYRYSAVVNLSQWAGCGTDWIIDWDLCCRNNAITSLNNPGSRNLYLTASLDNTLAPCNNSPRYLNDPTPFACVGQSVSYNHGFNDVDGDSLSFELAPALGANGSSIPYNAGYSFLQPVVTSGGANAVQINPVTGTITFVPSIQQFSVVTVRVREWRNGVQIGTYLRDVQFAIIACTNNLPSVSGVNGTNQYIYTVCAGESFCFNVNSADADPGQNVTMTWNNGIPGATFTTTTGALPVGTFCWTPTAADIGQNLFAVNVADDACALNGVNNFGYVVQVTPPFTPANAGPDQSVCGFTTTLAGVLPFPQVQGTWTVVSGSGTFANANSPTSAVSGLGAGVNVFRWTVNYLTCGTTSDDVTINAFDPAQPAANAGTDQSLCQPTTTATLAANVATTPAIGTWTLVNGTGTFANANSPTTAVSGLSVGANTFRWTIDNGACTPPTSDQVTVFLFSSSQPAANAGPDQQLCQPTTTTTLAGNAVTFPATGLWTVVSGTGVFANATLRNTTVSGLSVGVNTFRWTITNGPCTPPTTQDEVSITVFNAGSPAANAGADQQVCATTATLAGNTPLAPASGQWTLVSGTGAITAPTSPTSGVTGLGVGANVFQWTLNNGSCANGVTSDQVVITRFDATTAAAAAGPDQDLCTVGATGFATATMAANAATPPATGVWTLVSGAGTITTANSPTTTVTNIPVGVTVLRWTINNGPCTPPTTTDDVTIRVFDRNAAVAAAGPDQDLCAPVANVTLAANAAIAPGTGVWTVVSGSGTFANANSPTTTVSGMALGSNVYRWTITNGACPGATTSDEVRIRLFDPATAAANAGADQQLCGSSNTNLTGNTVAAPAVGTWTLVSGQGTIVDPTNPAASVTDLGLGVNVFRWSVSNGPCGSSSDEVSILRFDPNNAAANAGPDQSICVPVAPNVVTMAASAVTFPATGTWTVVTGSGTIVSPNSPTTQINSMGVGINEFRWTVSNGPCPAGVTTDVVRILVFDAGNPVANAGPDVSLCTTNGTITMAGSSLTIPATGQWTLVSGTGTITNPTSPTTTVTGLGVGQSIFQWTVSNGPCANGITTDQMSVFIYDPNNPVANAGADQSFCTPLTSTTMSGSAVAFPATGVWTVVSGAGTITNINDPNTTITALGLGTNQFAWTVNNGVCPNGVTSDVVNVELFNGSAQAADAGTDQSLCGTSSTAVMNATPATGLATGSWSVVQGTASFSDAASPTATVSGLSIGVNILRWSINNGACGITTDQVTILVYDPNNPVAAAGADQELCTPTTSTTLQGSALIIPAVGNWTLVSGSGTIANPTASSTAVSGLALGANVFRWQVNNGACTNPITQDEVTIFVFDLDAADANAGPDQEICAPVSSVSMAANSPVASAVGTWTLVNGGGTIVSPNSPNTSITGLPIGINVFAWTIDNGPCGTTTDQVRILVFDANNPVANAGLDEELCTPESSTTLLGSQVTSPATGQWVLISGQGTIASPTSAITVISGLGVGENIFQWTVSNGPCVNGVTSDLVSVRVFDASNPMADAGPDQEFCTPTSTSTLTGSAVILPATGQWELVSGSGTIADPNAATTAVTGLAVGVNTFRYTVSNGPCDNGLTEDLVSIFIFDANNPVADAGADQELCTPNTSTTMQGSAVTIPALGTWTLVSGGGTITNINDPNTTITDLPVGENIFAWTVENGPCAGSLTTDQVSIFVFDANNPVADAGPDDEQCTPNTITTLTGSSVIFPATGTWTLVSGQGTINSPNASITTVTDLGVGENIFEWTVSNGPCANGITTDQVTILIFDQGNNAANAGPDRQLCTPASATQLEGSPVTFPAVGTWTLVSGSGTLVDANDPNTLVLNPGVGENIFQWSVDNGPCESGAGVDQMSVFVFDENNPVANAGVDQEHCTPNVFTTQLQGSSVIFPAVGTWTLVSGTGSIADPNDPNTTVFDIAIGESVFLWTVVNGPCTNSITTDEVRIRIFDSNNPNAVAGDDQELCTPVTSATLAASAVTFPSIGTWTIVSGSGVITDVNNPNTTITDMTPGVTVVAWTVSNGPCDNGITSDQLVITLYDQNNPVANAGVDQELCTPTGTTTSTNLQGSAIIFPAVGTWSLVNGTGTIVDPNDPNSAVDGLSIGENLFLWTVTNGVCNDPLTTDLVSIFVFDENNPDAVAGPNQQICTPVTNAFMQGSPVTFPAQGTWTLVTGQGTIVDVNDPLTEITDLGIGVNNFSWTVDNGSCANAITTDVVTLILFDAQAPPADAGADQELCSPDDSATITGNPPVGAAFGTWNIVQGSGSVADPASPSTTVSGMEVGETILTWTLSSGICVTTVDSVSIFIFDPNNPLANAGLDQELCVPQDSVFMAGSNLIFPAQGTWTLVSGTGTPLDPNDPGTLISGLSTGENVFQWEVYNGPCVNSLSADQVTITLYSDSTSAANAGPDLESCLPVTAITLQGEQPIAPGEGTWTLIAGTGNILQPNNPNSQVTGLSQGVNTFVWTLEWDPCPNNGLLTDTVNVLVYNPNAPIAAAGPDQQLCSPVDQTVMAANTPEIPGVGTWTVISGPATVVSPNDPASVVTGLTVGVHELVWTIYNGQCGFGPPSTDTLTISVFDGEAPDAQTGNDISWCTPQDNAVLNANDPVFPAVGTWTVLNGSGTFADANDPNTAVFGLPVGQHDYLWTIDNGACGTSGDTISVFIFDGNSEAANAGIDKDLCTPNTTTDLNGNAVVFPATGLWTVVSGTAVFDDPTSPTTAVNGLSIGTNVLRWTITNEPCGTTSDDMVITVYDENQASANAGPDQQLCTPNTSTTLQGSAVTFPAVGTWVFVSGTGTISDPNAPNATISGLSVGQVVLRWTVENGPCANGTTFDDVIINIFDGTAAGALAGDDQDFCTPIAQSVTMFASSPIFPAIGTWTLLSGAAVIASPNDPFTAITGMGLGENVFAWTIDNGACGSSSDEVTIAVFDHTVPAADAGPDQNFCQDVSSTRFEAQAATSTATGTWALIAGAGEIAAPNDPTSEVTDLPLGNNWFTWTITNGPCPSTSDSMLVNVKDCLTILIPNAFSPNGDGVNDMLVITNIGSYPGNRLQVFNRYGNMVLDRGPYNNDWDGRSQTGALFGDILPESTYYYVLDLGNDTEAYTGYIYLRR